MIDRRTILKAGLAGVGGLAACSSLRSGIAAVKHGGQVRGPIQTCEVQTNYGKLLGRSDAGVLSFKGVPYAGHVTGLGRFKAPPKLEPWAGVRHALTYGPRAIQPVDPAAAALSSSPVVGEQQSEECLVLNIWTTSLNPQNPKPVMFYCHGGAFLTGAGGGGLNEVQDGANLAKYNDVIVVTVNHRLGLLGYLYLADLAGEEYATSGNQGMLDLVAALEWVKQNISFFGGDPDNVLIFGESGGGAKVATLLAMPAAHGLFHRASIESSPALRMLSKDVATEKTKAVLAYLKLSAHDWPQLLTIPTKRLLQAQRAVWPQDKVFNPFLPVPELITNEFCPVVDGRYLPQNPFDPHAPAISKNIPLMVGSNKDEASFLTAVADPAAFSLTTDALVQRLKRAFGDKADRVLETFREARPPGSPAEIYLAILTANLWWRYILTIAERKTGQGGAPVYMYRFDFENGLKWEGSNYPQKATHTAEIPFKFDNPQFEEAAGSRPERLELAAKMGRTWAAFARNGNPNNDAIPKWPEFTLDHRETMIWDEDCKITDDPCRSERLIWDQVGL